MNDDIIDFEAARTSFVGRARHHSQIVVLANREPYSHERLPDGDVVVQHSGSGVVAATEPLVRQFGGVWIAHGSGNADRTATDDRDSVLVPPDRPSYRLRRVWLDADEHRGYYQGFANEGLWPLCHRVHVRPAFRPADFDTYWHVNERFADATCEEADDRTVVIVHDYHLALAPMLIRERARHAAVIAFWHIPWPDVDRLGICPWATYLIEGLLAGDVVGFQTADDCGHFLDAAEHLLGATVERQHGAVTWLGRRTHVRAYPVSVPVPLPAAAGGQFGEAALRQVRARFGLQPSDRLIAGIDRMDYTKGLEEKLAAFECLLDAHPEWHGSAVFVQVAEPSRTQIVAYRELAERVRAAANAINVRFGTDTWRPVVLIEEHQADDEVWRLFRAADVCYVGSLHDGMNLVSKEFVSAREDDRGVLVLSRFAGAARELRDALIVNPYDIEQSANALAEALSMTPVEQQHRMRRMRARVKAWDCERWGTALLGDAARLCSARALQPWREDADAVDDQAEGALAR